MAPYRIPKISELEKKPWQYIASGSVQGKVPKYSYMSEEDARNVPRRHSPDSFDYPTYSQATAYEQHMARNMNELSYLGMTVKKSKDGISVHQRGYIDNMVSKFEADPESTCPETTSPTSSDFLN